MKKEIEYLKGVVNNPVRPFVAILGGAKVSGKIGVLEHLENKVDKGLIGGGLAFTFIKAMGYEVGDSLVESEMLETAQRIRKKPWTICARSRQRITKRATKPDKKTNGGVGWKTAPTGSRRVPMSGWTFCPR